MDKKVKIVLDMQAHFEEKITFFVRKVNKFQKTTVPREIQPFFLMVFWTNFAFFGRKVKKVPCIIGAISRKSTFWEFLVLKQTGLLGNKVKKVLDIQRHFEEKITFFVRKVNKLQGI